MEKSLVNYFHSLLLLLCYHIIKYILELVNINKPSLQLTWLGISAYDPHTPDGLWWNTYHDTCIFWHNMHPQNGIAVLKSCADGKFLVSASAWWKRIPIGLSSVGTNLISDALFAQMHRNSTCVVEILICCDTPMAVDVTLLALLDCAITLVEYHIHQRPWWHDDLNLCK